MYLNFWTLWGLNANEEIKDHENNNWNNWKNEQDYIHVPKTYSDVFSLFSVI